MYNICELCRGAVQQSSFDWPKVITPLISIIVLLVNILFYIIIAPRINFKFQKKEEFYKSSIAFLDFLSDIVSYQDFSDVPTKIRKFSLSLHMLFKSGTAPKPITDKLEEVFQSAKKRKALTEESEILAWELDFRELVRNLRKELSKYTGIF